MISYSVYFVSSHNCVPPYSHRSWKKKKVKRSPEPHIPFRNMIFGKLRWLLRNWKREKLCCNLITVILVNDLVNFFLFVGYFSCHVKKWKCLSIYLLFYFATARRSQAKPCRSNTVHKTPGVWRTSLLCLTFLVKS